jgi:hypothetical protein
VATAGQRCSTYRAATSNGSFNGGRGCRDGSGACFGGTGDSSLGENGLLILDDYESGHWRILPRAFSDFEVLQGGVGAGTRVAYTLKLGGRKRQFEADVSIPKRGRILVETDAANGTVTTFTVEPTHKTCCVRIETTWEASEGIAGSLERFLAPKLLESLYNDELDMLEMWAPNWLDME